MQKQSVIEHAISLLNYTRMSCSELRAKLIRKGEDEKETSEAVERLVELGLLNDRQYAIDLAAHYSRKGYGRQLVIAELYRRGIAKELFDEALESMPDNSEKLESLLKKKLDGSTDRAQIQKVCASLVRRGFSIDQIRSAMENLRLQSEDYTDE